MKLISVGNVIVGNRIVGPGEEFEGSETLLTKGLAAKPNSKEAREAIAAAKAARVPKRDVVDPPAGGDDGDGDGDDGGDDGGED